MRVSIVTPSFNQGQFIARTLDSVAAQEVEGLEHIVFDGASTDDTVEILESRSGSVTWVSEPDRGQAHAINKAIALSKGDVIGWLNSDDVYYPGAVAAALDFLDANPDVDVVYGMADHIDIDDVAFEPYPTEPWNSERLYEACFICQPAVFFRRRLIDSYGYLDESLHYCMDYEFWLRLAAKNVRFCYLPRKLAASRLYSENKTRSAAVAVHVEINNMFSKRFREVPEAWLYNYAHVATHAKVKLVGWPWWFARESGVRAVFAAIRWNGRVNRPLLHRLFPRWVGPAKLKVDITQPTHQDP